MSPEEKIKIYDIVMRHLGQETALFWARNQFFLIANTALIAVVAGLFHPRATSQTSTSSLEMVFLLIASIAGLLLSILWVVQVAFAWKRLEGWQKKVEEVEELALGSTLMVFRDIKSKRGLRLRITVLVGSAICVSGWITVWGLTVAMVLERTRQP